MTAVTVIPAAMLDLQCRAARSSHSFICSIHCIRCYPNLLFSVLTHSGFEITVHHPHTYVVKCIQLVRGE